MAFYQTDLDTDVQWVEDGHDRTPQDPDRPMCTVVCRNGQWRQVFGSAEEVVAEMLAQHAITRSEMEKQVVGALKSAIAAHGPITEENVSSAAKRVIGVLKHLKLVEK